MNKLFKLFDQYPFIPILMIAGVVIMGIYHRRGERAKNPPTDAVAAAGPLDATLLHWTSHDKFRVRDLLNGGVLILGRAGSGKTSSSGRTLMTNIAKNRESGGLILAAKPEDAADVVKIFKAAGRLEDLIIFDQRTGKRCNLLNCLKRPRDVVTFIMTLSEVMKRGDSKGGGENNRFYEAQEERCIYNSVSALRAAGEPITGLNLHKFIMTAARTPAELASPEWQSKYQNKVLDKGFEAKKDSIEAHDFQICVDFWIKEWAGLMDEKTRGNILAGVQGTLHIMNSGLVREMCSGETNCSPQDVLRGKWVLVNFPPSSFGAAGQLISAGWKQLVELAILERHADDKSPFVIIWCDEAHQFVTNYDSSFIAQCRSHKGCLVYLTQSVSSFYAGMKGEAGKHQADSLLANFSTTIVHVCDATTAKWASGKLGRKKEVLYSGSSSAAHDAFVWDLVNGRNNTSASFGEHYEQVLQDQAFMVGRTGGPANNFIVDAVVIRSGEPFSDGRNFLKTTFGQER